MTRVTKLHRLLAKVTVVCVLSCALGVLGSVAGWAEGVKPNKAEAPDKTPLTPAEQFAKMDKNGDGVLTPDELPQPEKFARLDWNGDGSITLEEFKTGPKPLTEAEKAAELEKQFRKLDADGDGKLTPQEFTNAEKFARFDRNTDGVVTLDEMKAGMAPPPKEDPIAKIERYFREKDADGNGVLSQQEVGNAKTFAKLDLNGDGSVTLDEAKKAMQPEKPPQKDGGNAAPEDQQAKTK